MPTERFFVFGQGAMGPDLHIADVDYVPEPSGMSPFDVARMRAEEAGFEPPFICLDMDDLVRKGILVNLIDAALRAPNKGAS
jgi:hypothetical protein